MHMPAGRHDRQHVAPTAEVERLKRGGDLNRLEYQDCQKAKSPAIKI